MKLSEKKKALILSLKDKVKESCPECKGIGCKTCETKANIIAELGRANAPSKFWQAEFKDYVAGDLAAKERLIRYVCKLEEAYENGYGLFLSGVNGVGKTLLAVIVMKWILRNSYSIYYITLKKAIDNLLDEGARDDIKDILLNKDFLVVDEVDKTYQGSEKSKELIDVLFFEIFKERADAKAPTILIANNILEEVQERYALGLRSIFKETLIDLSFVGKDYRSTHIAPELDKFLEHEYK
jgi:DNA replication protein DnaC